MASHHTITRIIDTAPRRSVPEKHIAADQTKPRVYPTGNGEVCTQRGTSGTESATLKIARLIFDVAGGRPLWPERVPSYPAQKYQSKKVPLEIIRDTFPLLPTFRDAARRVVELRRMSDKEAPGVGRCAQGTTTTTTTTTYIHVIRRYSAIV
jgi:hypothetical protein